MSAPALLLVHGYPFDHTLWDPVTPLLDKDLTILAPDLRGFDGRSPADEPSLEHMAEDLKRQLDEHKVAKAVVAGMSMGGYVALAFAERFPQLLAGFGLISSQAAADTEQARAGRRATIEKVRREGVGVAVQAAIAKLFAAHNSTRPDLIGVPTRAGERAGVAGITWALEAMARRPDRTELFKKLRVPVLVLHGAQDQFIAAERARELAKLAVDACYEEIAQAGHATPLEAPEQVADALNELVRRCVAKETIGN